MKANLRKYLSEDESLDLITIPKVGYKLSRNDIAESDILTLCIFCLLRMHYIRPRLHQFKSKRTKIGKRQIDNAISKYLRFC